MHKVHDGLVLAADSATSMMAVDEAGNPAGISMVYNNSNKVFNLCKGLPIGAVTWGLGSIGVASIATLMKDLRYRFCGDDDNYSGWALKRDSYTVEEVANRMFEFIFNECYEPATSQQGKPGADLGFVVEGYSAGENLAELFLIEMSGGKCEGPILYSSKEEPSSITWHGQPRAIHRLILGFDDRLPTVLQDGLGIDQGLMPQVFELLTRRLAEPVITPAMPIQDAIDLALFLANVSAQYSHFAQGPDTVGGLIEIAAITKHEEFKWIRRKYYYDRELNPEVRHG